MIRNRLYRLNSCSHYITFQSSCNYFLSAILQLALPSHCSPSSQPCLAYEWGFVTSTLPLLEYTSKGAEQLLQEDPRTLRRKALRALRQNSIVVCTVRSIRPFGLIVDLVRVCDRPSRLLQNISRLNISGLIHSSELSERYVANLDDLLYEYRIGDVIKGSNSLFNWCACLAYHSCSQRL